MFDDQTNYFLLSSSGMVEAVKNNFLQVFASRRPVIENYLNKHKTHFNKLPDLKIYFNAALVNRALNQEPKFHFFRYFYNQLYCGLHGVYYFILEDSSAELQIDFLIGLE